MVKNNYRLLCLLLLLRCWTRTAWAEASSATSAATSGWTAEAGAAWGTTLLVLVVSAAVVYLLALFAFAGRMRVGGSEVAATTTEWRTVATTSWRATTESTGALATLKIDELTKETVKIKVKNTVLANIYNIVNSSYYYVNILTSSPPSLGAPPSPSLRVRGGPERR